MAAKRSSSKKRSGNSVDQLVQRLRKDKLFRMKLISRLTDALQELGVRAEDISLIPAVDVISEDIGGTQIVIITRSDSKKNTKSIIVGRSAEATKTGGR